MKKKLWGFFPASNEQRLMLADLQLKFTAGQGDGEGEGEGETGAGGRARCMLLLKWAHRLQRHSMTVITFAITFARYCSLAPALLFIVGA